MLQLIEGIIRLVEGIVRLVEFFSRLFKNPIEILFLIIGGILAVLTVIWLSGEPSLERGGFVIIIITALAVLVLVPRLCRWFYNAYKRGFQNILYEVVTTVDDSFKSHNDTAQIVNLEIAYCNLEDEKYGTGFDVTFNMEDNKHAYFCGTIFTDFEVDKSILNQIISNTPTKDLANGLWEINKGSNYFRIDYLFNGAPIIGFYSNTEEIDVRTDSNNDSTNQYEIPLNEEDTHRQQSSTAQNTEKKDSQNILNENATTDDNPFKSHIDTVEMAQKLKSSSDNIFDGVCAGLANYFGLDKTSIRATLLLVWFGGVGVLAFIILWIIMSLK